MVVALLAGAALALQARQGLDWSELADPVHVRWARVLAGSVLLLAVGGAARSVLRRLRAAARRRRARGAAADPEGEEVPLLLRVLATVLVLAALALAVWVVQQVAGPTPPEAAPPAPSSDGGSPAPSDGGRPAWPVLLAVAAVLVGAVIATRLSDVRNDHRTREEEADGGQPQEVELAAAIEAAEIQLGHHDDTRMAIVAAYRAMTASLTADLARRRDGGAGARASDTPTELLERAVAAGQVGPGPAGDLTALFREARFSRHPMGPADRRAAQQALALVRDELAAVRNRGG